MGGCIVTISDEHINTTMGSVAGDKSVVEPEVVQVSEEQLAEIAQATKSLMEKPSGKSMEIVLSPAVKKQKSRVSPPTSPTSNVTQESIVQKLKGAEERRQSIESAKLKKIKEHQEHGDWVRNINNPEEKEKAYVMELQINIKAKEERARELKEKKDAELREKRETSLGGRRSDHRVCLDERCVSEMSGQTSD